MPDAPTDHPTKAAAPSAPGEPPSSPVPVPLEPPPATHGPVATALAQIAAALRFFSRLPLPELPQDATAQAGLHAATAPPAVAVAGALIGVVPAVVLLLAMALGLPHLLAAAVAVTALALVTGALHEDGLADTADGLAGGSTKERRLEIMRDSRSGAFGVTALILSLLLRITALAALADRLGPGGAALALVAIAGTSRVAALLPLTLLEPARPQGFGTAAGRPDTGLLLATSGLCLAGTIALLWPTGILVVASGLAVAAAFAVAWLVAKLAEAKIGGHTGDIAGAAQQMAEIAMLLLLVAVAAPGVRS